jgi:hypothetical protein
MNNKFNKGPLDLHMNVGMETGPQNGDIVANIFRVKARLAKKFGLASEVLEDTSSDGRPFLDGEHNIQGYDRVVVNGGEIIILKSSKGERPQLSIGMMVELKGDSRGYIPSGHSEGDQVEIIEFTEPFRDGGSDRIIMVKGNGHMGLVKPSNIIKVIAQPLKN